MLITTATGLVQLVERLTAEREVTGSIPETKSILRIITEKKSARPSCGSDDQWRSRLQLVLSCLKNIDTQLKSVFCVVVVAFLSLPTQGRLPK